MTCQGISLGLVSIGCCFFLSVTRRGVYLFFTRRIAEFTDFLCPEFSNYRIFFTRSVSEITWFSLSRICEFANCFFTRNVAEVTEFFVPRLVLGPTDRREVIAEFLSITRSVADGCGACSSCEWGLFVVVYRPIRGVCV